MNTVIALTALIAKYIASIKGFSTRIEKLAAQRKNLDVQMTRDMKDLKNLHEREEIVRSYLKKTERGTVRYEESAGGLEALAARVQKKNAEVEVVRQNIATNDKMVTNVKKFLETSKRHLAESEANLIEVKENEARQKAANEVARIEKLKVDRKAAKHAKNRALHRAKKEAKRAARKNGNRSAPNPVPTVEAPPDEFYMLANKLGADITNAEDREVITSLLKDVQATT